MTRTQRETGRRANEQGTDMTTSTEPVPGWQQRAAVAATKAPSVHNTQPWRFVLKPDCVEIHADWNRQLRVLDPSRRQLLISCGCALFNARVALAALGYDAVVERLPEPAQTSVIARISLPSSRSDWVPIAALEDAIDRRQSNRRNFEDETVSAEVSYDLVESAAAEGAQLFRIREAKDLLATASLSQQADAAENANPAYRAELRAWTSDDPTRRDGVSAQAVPHVTGESEDDIPVRDFDTRGFGWLPSKTQSSTRQSLFLLGTVSENEDSWLRAGEALERVWLEATKRGYVASLFTQVIEVPRTRALLRDSLRLQMYPHVLLRIGRAPGTSASRRRAIGDVIVDQTG